MNSLLLQAQEVATERDSNCIGLQEILFLMRRDKSKLVRLLRHLSFRDSLSSLVPSSSSSSSTTASSAALAASSLGGGPASAPTVSSLLIQGTSVAGASGFLDLGSLASSSSSTDVASSSFSSANFPSQQQPATISGININIPRHQSSSNESPSHQQQPLLQEQILTKRKKICIEFLKHFDEFGLLSEEAFSDDYIDSINFKRSIRRDRMTREMTDQEYSKFCDCRRVSFTRNPQKFRQWLLQDFVAIDGNHVPRIDNFALETFQYLAYETVAELVDLCFLVMQEQQRDAGDPVKGLISLKKQPLKGHHTCPQTSESFMESSSLDQQSNPSMNPSMHHPPSFSVMKKRRKSEGWMESPGSLFLPEPDVDCIQPLHVREVARRYFSPAAAIFSLMSATNRISFLDKKPIAL